MFGCSDCYGIDPQATDRFFRAQAGKGARMVVDDSHFIVRTLACPSCGQNFVSVFTERIDWVSGDDPQTRTLLPISSVEREQLEQEFVSSKLLQWAQGRRYHVWFSSGETAWLEGGYHIPPHD